MPLVSKTITPGRKAAAVFLLALAIGVVNWFFPGNDGFLQGFFNPYVTLSFFIAVSYGKYYGFLALACAVLEVGLFLPLARSLAAGLAILPAHGRTSAGSPRRSLPPPSPRFTCSESCVTR